MLHAGVTDRRSWHDVAPLIEGTVYAYDRRGFGATPPSKVPFTHLDDLLTVLDGLGSEPAWLVGNSVGGALAVDAALTTPERVTGLVLLAPAVSGAPGPDALDVHTTRLEARIEAAMEAGDLDRLNGLLTRLWLDGPAAPDGRVGGAVRDLALVMNAAILAHGAAEDAGDGDLDAWARLEEVRVPTTIVWGDLDVPFLTQQYATMAARIPAARAHVVSGAAHLLSLERPAEVADLVNEAIAPSSHETGRR